MFLYRLQIQTIIKLELLRYLIAPILLSLLHELLDLAPGDNAPDHGLHLDQPIQTLH